MAPCKIHNVGFYAPEPRAIYCMALQKKEGKLAVARSDASIEIWNLNHICFIERTIPSNLENFSIEGLGWYGNRLFSVGLHGWLVEYNLDSLGIKNKWSITGEVGTCLDLHKTHIAIGTDQGYINIYEITEEGVQFEKFLDKQEGRVLCLKYNANGKFVVAGSINAIRIWDVKTGHAIHKMLLGRSEAKKDTVVWCLEVLKDFTIFSGDSRGVLTLWDGKLGAQIESYQSHKADITALCTDDAEQTIYAAGVDPLIANYQKIKVGTNVKWVKSIQRKIHEHDVRAMVFHRGKLYSAGVDSYLVCSYHPPKTLIKHAPIFQSPFAQLASRSYEILLRYSKHIELWSLGAAKQAEPNYEGLLEIRLKPKKLLVIQKTGKNWANEDEAEAVICSSISPGGHFIFLGTSTGFRLYGCLMSDNKPLLRKIEDLDDDNVPCVQAVFNDKRNQLIVALNNGSLVVYDLEDLNPFVSQRIERNKEHLSDTISLMTISSCGKLLVVADCKSNIVVYQHNKDGYSFRVKLPRSQIPTTAIAINSLTSCVIVAYADNSMHEYDLETERFTNFSKKLEQSGSWKSKTHVIRSITFDSRNKDAVLVHDDSNIFVITRDGTTSTTSNAKSKVAKTDAEHSLANGDVHSAGDLKISTIPKFKHLAFIAAVREGELVAVQVNPLSILEKLPPAFAQKTFGTK